MRIYTLLVRAIMRQPSRLDLGRRSGRKKALVKGGEKGCLKGRGKGKEEQNSFTACILRGAPIFVIWGSWSCGKAVGSSRYHFPFRGISWECALTQGSCLGAKALPALAARRADGNNRRMAPKGTKSGIFLCDCCFEFFTIQGGKSNKP